jgi:hypothetical protein
MIPKSGFRFSEKISRPVIARSASDEAIQKPAAVAGLLRFARNDGMSLGVSGGPRR